jgi:DNA-binding NarL/FixJ family response regulator
VAELLEISEKTVENQMAIALKKLSASILFKLA